MYQVICCGGFLGKEIYSAQSKLNLFAPSSIAWVSKSHLYDEEESEVITEIIGTADTKATPSISIFWTSSCNYSILLPLV